ncbi:MAG: hypothetical protein U1E49_07785 [Hyphomicrobiaceae bacterium]
MMKKLMMTAGALAVAATMATAPAQAGYGGGVYFGHKVYVTYNSGCYWLKKKALRAEYRGQWHKAEYWWDRYWACKNGYDY